MFTINGRVDVETNWIFYSGRICENCGWLRDDHRDGRCAAEVGGSIAINEPPKPGYPISRVKIDTKEVFKFKVKSCPS